MINVLPVFTSYKFNPRNMIMNTLVFRLAKTIKQLLQSQDMPVEEVHQLE